MEQREDFPYPSFPDLGPVRSHPIYADGMSSLSGSPTAADPEILYETDRLIDGLGPRFGGGSSANPSEVTEPRFARHQDASEAVQWEDQDNVKLANASDAHDTTAAEDTNHRERMDEDHFGTITAHDVSSNAFEGRSPPARQNSWALKSAACPPSKVVTYSWGRGDFGQLGQGNASNQSTPQPVEALRDRDVVLVTGNLYNSAFLIADGDLLTCGNNENSQLGWESSKLSSSLQQFTEVEDGILSLTSPSRLASLDAYSVHHAAFGLTHVMSVVADGMLASWGANDFGQLAQGNEGGDVTHPRLVKRLRGHSYARVAAGQQHTVTLSSAGLVSSCGHNGFGQLGRAEGEGYSRLVEVTALWPWGIVQIACGDNHSLAMSAAGQVYAWGRGKYGQLGLGNFENSNQPREVNLPSKALQIACGADHTLTLVKGGQIFSWGRGTWGQTGHNTTENLCAPKLVEALQSQIITQVSAGSRHSLALSQSGVVFAFGSCEHGQLGLGSNVDQLNPVPIPENWRGMPHFVVAAGDHSIAVCRSQPARDIVLAGPQSRYGAGLTALQLPCFDQLIDSAKKDRSEMVTLKHAVEDIFSNPGYLLSQVSLRPDEDLSSAALNPQIPRLFAKVLEVGNEEVALSLAHATSELLDRLDSSLTASSSGTDPSGRTPKENAFWGSVLYILFQNPLNNGSVGRRGMKKLIRNVIVLHPDIMLSRWLDQLSAEKFKGLLLRPLQRYLSYVAVHQNSTVRLAYLLHYTARGQSSREDLLEALVILDALHRHWLKMFRSGRNDSPVPEFYNLEVSEHLHMGHEYVLWQEWQAKQRSLPASAKNLISICQLPFCLNPEAKAKLLKVECLLQRQSFIVDNSLIQMQGPHGMLTPRLSIHVRREHLLRDVVSQVSRYEPHFLKLPLMVRFSSNGVQEEGVDQGGVTKEFFQLLIKVVFEENLGMFTLDQETQNFWFNFNAMEGAAEFKMVGRIIGLAVYNGVILDIHFPPVFYKKLIPGTSGRIGFQDLKQAFPELGRGLQQLLDIDEDVESMICRNFEVEYDYYGELKKQALKEGGSSIAVNNENRKEFVELYTKWKLHDSISSQFSAFADGFLEVCGGPALYLLTSEELELVICGVPQLNFEDLESVAHYEADFNQEHPTIKALWDILHSFSFEEKQAFLKFTTGCDRAPVGGLGNLTLTIQRAGGDTEALPTSHTCFNYLLIPEYSSAEKLRHKLRLAINYAEGFGLE